MKPNPCSKCNSTNIGILETEITTPDKTSNKFKYKVICLNCKNESKEYYLKNNAIANWDDSSTIKNECICTVQRTDITGICLIYPNRHCPFHKQYYEP